MKPVSTDHRDIANRIVWVSIGLALLFWFLEASMHVFVFHGGSLIGQLFHPALHELWMRSLVVCLIIAFGAYAQILINRNLRAEKIIREREENLAVTLNSIGDAVIVTDKDGKVSRMNPVAEKLTGWALDEAEGRPLSEAFHIINAQSREVVKNPVEKVLREGKIVGLGNDTALIAKDGTERQIADSGAPIFNTEGAVIGVVMVFRDITQEYRVQREIRESEDKYKSLFEFAGDALFIMSVSEEQGACFVDCNDSTLRLFGCTERNQIIGKQPDDFSPPTQPDGRPSNEKARERINAVMEGHPQIFEWAHHRLDSTPFWVEVNLSRIEIKGEFFLQAVVRDITDRKRAEDALRDSERFLADLFESVQDGISVLNTDLTILHVNGVMKRWYSENLPLEGKKCHECYHNSDKPCDPCPTLRCFNTGQTEQEVVPGLPGSPVEWVDLFSYPVKDKESGEVTGVVEFVRDITERKRTEQELTKIQKLESLGILAGGIAHDFNNLLTAVLGNITLAKIDMESESRPFEFLSDAEKTCLRANDLTGQLLTFAKGGAPIRKTAVIANLIKDSAGFAVRGSKARCDFLIPDDLWPAMIDEGQISQVINNLAINADQAMPEGGIIELSAENFVVEEGSEKQGLPLEDGKYIKISVKDDGIGISTEHLPKIFDPYFTTKQQGSGLGLATSYSIIKQHNGHIAAESELGTGTTFSVYLPSSEEPIEEHKVEKEIVAGRGKILFMDDEEAVRITAGRMLERLGYKVEFASDGDEAVRFYKKAKKSGGPFDAAIIDLTIPGGMGGRETIKKLLEVDPDVKAIVSSGYSSDPVMANYEEYGFSNVLVKPYLMEELSEKLHQLLGGEVT